MKRVAYATFGGPEVLEVQEVEEPHPGPGQLRIAVRAAGVNPVDWRTREGQFETTPTESLGATKLPAGVGQDASGVVDEVGEHTEGVQVGDRVFGRGTDTYAQHAVLNDWALIPDGMSFDEAAGYPSVVETATRVLREVGVQAGQTLLVSGAAGGVGSAVLQFARDRGIRVIGTASASNQDYLRDLGAHPTTYGDGWVERVRQLGPIDAALDLAGAGVVADLVELVGDPKRVLSIADLDAPKHGVRFAGLGGDTSTALVEAVDLMLRNGLHIPIQQRYSLDEAAAAHADSQAGHTRGRRVIVLQ